MCSKDEVQTIINNLETKLEIKFIDLEKRYKDNIEKSYMSISKSVSDFGNDLRELTKITKENYSKREIDNNNINMQSQLDRIENMISIFSKKTEENEINFLSLNTKINTSLIVLGVTIPFIISLITWIFLNELKNIRETIVITKQTIEETLPDRVKPILEEYKFQVTSEKDNN